MKKIKYSVLIASLLFGFSGCQNKQDIAKQQTIEEQYNGVGEAYARDIAKKYPKIDESKLLVSCLTETSKSDIRDDSEKITFVTNKCTQELRRLTTEDK